MNVLEFPSAIGIAEIAIKIRRGLVAICRLQVVFNRTMS